ncbi:ABATE domain-containing protein [Streptosporangium sp. NPDC023615]|uniref:CGNR zinc finger domain-containing protein n=1 Tax=Streptosporangium sp. NPDC023615 TaxID=3154794 RepID=UPI00343C1975
MPGTELPILGTEPLAVELANTLYGSGEERIDFLRTARRIDEWFASVSAEHGVTAPAAMGRDAERVRTLRDCVHSLLSAAVDERTPDEASVERLNGFAAAAPTHLRLDWTGAGGPVSRWRDTTVGGTAVLGRIATCCIELLTGPEAGKVRRCQGPGCSLIFMKSHPRRRWCHPSCGHRDRQARYHRRHLTTSGAS